MNQFFYTRKEPIPGTDPIEFEEFNDSFNIEKVIRSFVIENKNRLVLLDDIHERSLNVPNVDKNTGRVKGEKRERNTYQTEVYLSSEDSYRFEKIMSITD